MADRPPPTDDLSIANDAELWRRIPPWHFVFDENLGRIRPSSAAFDDDEDGSPMSVIIGAESAGPASALRGHAGFALAAFTAGLARECQQIVERTPLPEEPAHAHVIGKKTRGVRSRLAKAASWVVSPPDH